jgi:hypothetical protein
MRNPVPVGILAYSRELINSSIAATITIRLYCTANLDGKATERLASQWSLEHIQDPRDRGACRGLFR